MEFLTAAATVSQLGGQAGSLFSYARRFYEEFKDAQGNHSEFTADLDQIWTVCICLRVVVLNADELLLKMIESAATGINSLTADLGEDKAKLVLGNLNIDDLQKGGIRKIDQAREILGSCNATKFSGKARFVWKQGKIQAIMMKLSQFATFFTMALTTMLLNVIKAGLIEESRDPV
jgi:hypothetical protein